ncbi:Protein disulfide isomerase [Seminavis robusta]|uniref:Protein disulfide isomerase n=1 Tax=Seminavis robusta TaxID=568900 RepID=A0A9N8F100_9STRA|nr:Protein disulfide isomerase [Seminavis robusta]|eukprot:Sro2542_g330690.1 Protein disulfide isomerase (235) ;mRNA; f:525-1376
MWRVTLLLLLLSLVSRAAGDQQALTAEAFDELTSDKAIFIRFVTKWCEECAETEEDWAKLKDEWKDHSIGFVREVFCDDEETELICESFEVAGYPSIYWGDPQSPELYRGKLDYESLSSFAEENLKSLPCSVTNLDACDAKIKKIIEKLSKKSLDELEAMEKQVIGKVDEEQNRFDTAAMKLQEQYKQLATNFNTKVDKLRDDSGFKWLQQILNQKYEEQELEDDTDEPEKDEL